ncbi:MAG: trigger factor [bacterium]
MEIKVHSPEDWLRELEIDIEPDRLKRKVAETLNELAPRAELPGFRKGRVPRPILEKRLAASVEESAVRELVEETTGAALEQQEWRLAAEPDVTEFELRPDKSIHVKLRVEIFPEFELKDYKGLAVERHEPTGFDQELERRMRQLQDRCATWRSVPGPAAKGLFVLADWRTFDGEAEVSKPRTNLMLELGDPMNFEEVNQGLVGAMPGEERAVEVTFPADHPEKTLAGRKVSFRFAVREVKEKVIPPVDEDLALALGYDTLDELRKDLNESILADRARLIVNDQKNQLFDQLLAAHEFTPPDSWVKHNLERLGREYDLPDDEGTGKKLTEVATRRARFDIIAERIARMENITVTPEEVEKQVRLLAEQSRRPPEEFAHLLDNPAVRAQLLREKVMEFLLENATVRGTLLGADGKPASSGDEA